MNEQINILLAKYIAGEATDAECSEAKTWIAQSENNEAVYIEMYDAWHAALALAGDKLVDTDAAYNRFESIQTDTSTIPASRKLYRMMAAEAAIAVIREKHSKGSDPFSYAIEIGGTIGDVIMDLAEAFFPETNVNKGVLFRFSRLETPELFAVIDSLYGP